MYEIQQAIKVYASGVTASFAEDDSVVFTFKVGDMTLIYKTKTGEIIPHIDEEEMNLDKWVEISQCDPDGIIRIRGKDLRSALHQAQCGARAAQQIEWRS